MENDNKNVILITMDCLRADHVGFMGYERDTTPYLDSLAKKSAVFTKAFSAAPYTTASFTSIFTGTYPIYKGNVLIRDRITLAEILRDNGYFTVGVHSNPQFLRFRGYRNGFGIFEDIILTSNKNRNAKTKNSLQSILKIGKKLYWKSPHRVKYLLEKSYFAVKYYAGDLKNGIYAPAIKTTNFAIEILERIDTPFFLWVHYMDTHHPYFPPKDIFEEISDKKYDLLRGLLITRKCHHFPCNPSRDDKEYLIDLYDASIKHVDYSIKLLFEKLKEHDLLKDTYIILTADHGEEFWEHGHYGHDSIPNIRPTKLYNEMIHVPLIIIGPRIKKNKEIDIPVSLIDMVPTILDILNIEHSLPLEGESLLELIRNSNRENPIFAEATDPGDPVGYARAQDKYEIYTVMIDNWKYIHYTTDKRSDELYDLNRDPNELNNVIDQYPEIVDELKRKILDHIRGKNYGMMNEKAKITSAIQRLKLRDKL